MMRTCACEMPRLIGVSSHMQRVFAFIEKIADTDSTVLITGESGTGKEVVAREIHLSSGREKAPFVPLNCAAIPEDLLESELFGHEKGAFTGAVNTRIGRFELADGGTLFLDEIGELHPSLQVKLLRVLQEQEFERVGGTRTVKVDVRIIAATNKDLEKATMEGAFREDLYYRLNVLPLNLPPLRRRTDDIPVLIDYFMEKFCHKKNRPPLAFNTEAMACIKAYRWPGNVRELENFIERVVILDDDGLVTMEDLPERYGTFLRDEVVGAAVLAPAWSGGCIPLPQEGVDLNAVLDEIERNMIIQALERSGGVKKRAASLLGLNRTTLLEKLKKKGIESQPEPVS